MTSIDGNMNGPIHNNNNKNIDPNLEGLDFGRFEEILAELSDLETEIPVKKKQKTEKLESVVLENRPQLSQIHAIDEGIVGVGKLQPISKTEYTKINSHINTLIQNELPHL
jgi:hypothetical protein